MALDLGASLNPSSSSALNPAEQSATTECSSDRPSNNAVIRRDSPALGVTGSADPAGSPRRRDSNLGSRLPHSPGNAADHAEGSVLGKRSASAMEGTARALQDTVPSSEPTAKPRQQAIDQVISSVFRRSSMISPMDSVDETSTSRSHLEASPSSYHHVKLPPPTSPLALSSGSKMASLNRRNLSDASNDASEEGQLLPSLPGFKSIFGDAEQGMSEVVVST
jgi:hypothetical protein